MMPLRPPMMNMEMNPIAKYSGDFTLTEPPHSVAIQLKTLTPVGTAMAMVKTAKTESAIGPRPTVNMWCAHTPKPKKAMAMPEKITTG